MHVSWARRGVSAMLKDEPDVEKEGPTGGDEERLPQSDLADQFGSNPEREDDEAEELERAAEGLTSHRRDGAVGKGGRPRPTKDRGARAGRTGPRAPSRGFDAYFLSFLGSSFTVPTSTVSPALTVTGTPSAAPGVT